MTVDSRDSQLKTYEKYKNKELTVGDKWYLISITWFRHWEAYVQGKGSNSPGKINNKDLYVTGTTTLRNDLSEELDFKLVPAEVWTCLAKAYSTTSESDTIERTVINDSMDRDNEFADVVPKVEIRHVPVRMCVYDHEHNVKTIEMSRQTPINDLIETMANTFSISTPSQPKIFFMDKAGTQVPVEFNEKSTLSTIGYAPDDDVIVLKNPGENGSASTATISSTPRMLTRSAVATPPPAPPAPTVATQPTLTSTTPNRIGGGITTRSQDNFYSRSSNYSSAYDHRPGLCGLSNLGNTCFMNSSLQCMSNVPPLTTYFLQGRFREEINTNNPLGRQGEIAESYAELISDMWSGRTSYSIPRNFKLKLGRFAPQFSGFQQQDSQELLAFLLDGLHEDLNRIQKRPYVELGSHHGKTDEKFAEESWLDHKKRNDSIIVDLFHGLLKSTLNCLVCGEISIKFDPYCYLSVPLPTKKERLVEAYFVPLNVNPVKIVKVKLNVNKQGTVLDMCAALELLMPETSKHKMAVADVYSNKLFKIYEPGDSISLIRERDDIYMFELAAKWNSSEHVKVRMHLREKSASSYSSSYSSSYFGLPLLFSVPKENLKYGTLYQYAQQNLKRFFHDYDGATAADHDDTRGGNNMLVDENSNSAIGSDETPATAKSNAPFSTTRPFTITIVKGDTHDSYDTLGRAAAEYDDAQEIDSTSLCTLNSSSSSYSSGYSTRQSQMGKELSQVANIHDYVIQLLCDMPASFTKKYYNKAAALENVEEHPSCNSQLTKKKDVISLGDCLNLFTRKEELSENDYWYCSKCKQHQQSTKKFDIWSLPPVLVVHLKRFSYTRHYRDKIDTLVEFPLTDMDMSPYLINKKATMNCINGGQPVPTNYNLIAVSNHYGSLGGGHYTAYGRNIRDNNWYNFDDSSVSNADPSSVCSPAAYVLVYLRQDYDTKHRRMSTSENEMDYQNN